MATTASYVWRPSTVRVVVLDTFVPVPRGAAVGPPLPLTWATKDPGDVLDYTIDFSPAFVGNQGDVIADLDVAISPAQPGIALGAFSSMPTIDQLAPAFAASDADELLINQNGVSRKISRALLIAGLQPQIAAASGTLLGNPGPGFGAPSSIAVGDNLTLHGGKLSATAVPYVVASLPSGTVPAADDMVPLGQGGANAAVTYSQFMSGIAEVNNVDISKLSVTPTGSGTPLKIGDLAATTALTTGSTMTGPLVLSATPSLPLHAATKQYVDAGDAAALPTTGGVLSGPLTLSGSPTLSLHAATKIYVDGQTSTLLPKSGGMLSGALTLAGDPAQPMDATTRRYTDAGDASNASAIALEASARTSAMGAVQTTAASAQSAATTAQANAAAAQTTAGAALANAAAAQSLANAALPSTGGTLTGDLSVTTSHVYAGADDFAAVRAQGRPADGKAMLYVNKIGSSATDANLISSYYYVNDTGGSGSPRLVNNFQANVVSTPVSGMWLTHLGITSSAVGGNQGQNGHLAADLQAIRDGATPIGNTTVQTSLASSSPNLAVINLANFSQAPITSGASAGKLTSLVNATAIATVTTASAQTGTINAVLQVASTVGILPGMFCWGTNIAAYVVSTSANTITLSSGLLGALSSGTTVNAGWALLVKVGRHFYHLVAVSGTAGVGTMTFAEPVTTTDAVAGNLVTAAQGGAPLWSFVAEIQDHTNLPSSAAGFCQIGELDLSGNGDDDGGNALVYNPASGTNLPQGGRCFLSFVASKFNLTGPDFVMNNGLAFTTIPGASINSVLFPNVTFNAAVLDTRYAVASSINANAIWLADRHRLAFSTDGSANIAYDPGTSALNINGQVRFAAPPVMPGYTVSTLPQSPTPGAKAYASNGRKAGELAGAGTGVEVFADGLGRWISVLSGTQVQA